VASCPGFEPTPEFGGTDVCDGFAPPPPTFSIKSDDYSAADGDFIFYVVCSFRWVSHAKSLHGFVM
jgi:hypothetical protein